MRRKMILILVFAGLLAFNSPTYAFFTPHPLPLFQQGKKVVEKYRGSPDDLVKAKQKFLEIIEKFPWSPLGYLGMSHIYVIEAYQFGSHYDMNKIQNNALPFAVQALELGPSLQDAHDQYEVLGRIFEQFSNQQKSAKEYLALFPENPETYFVIGQFMEDQREFAQALELYKSALHLEPNDNLRVEILKKMAWINLEHLDRAEAAITNYQQALTIDQRSAVLKEYLGLAYLKKGDYGQAITNFKESLQIWDSPIVRNYFLEAQGYLLVQQGKKEEAISYFKKIILTGMENLHLCMKLGDLYFDAGHYEDAYRQFRQAIAINPFESKAYYLAGRSAQLSGDNVLAVHYYEKYLNLNRDGQEAEWIRANIPELSYR
ncbi:MAG: tetratricopeptide repeat protein [Candidatus Omnitrophica bacterium]|nr:tetratricopeptide repeat protein [Candidatus Omnitrophota bacterium]